MKKFISVLAILVILAGLGTGGYAAWSWFSLDNTLQPTPQVTVNAKTPAPSQTDWTIPVFGKLLKRNFYWENDEISDIKLDTFDVEITLPEEYTNQIVVTKSQTKLFEGDISKYRDFSFPENGDYAVDITLTKPQNDNSAYGQMLFSIPVVIDVPPPPPPLPTMKVSSNSVIQGDSLRIELLNVPEGETPVAQTDLSLTTFMPMKDGRWIAYTGIADSRAPGNYEIKVSFKDFDEVIPVTVTQGKFNRQDLTINTSDPIISEANSAAAYKQYREAIRPLYETTDSTMYWSGKFIQPIKGRLSSEYGLLRYTNGSKTPSRHAGIDLAAATGTKIQAPAAGRVVFSDYLLNTGNTLVIEHGGGLKSYYFHLSARDVAVDDIVKAGQLLGKVGTTGYSTGPHLHFEIRIGSQNLDPFKFFNGTGGCFVSE